MSTPQTVVLVDADNTLWDTDAVFRTAQLSLLGRVEQAVHESCIAQDRLVFVRSYDQALAQAHHLHLRYPPQMLVRGVEAGLRGVQPETAASNVIAGRLSPNGIPTAVADAILADYVSSLSEVPKLLPMVAEGVRVAQDSGLKLYVMTEGRIDKQKRLLAAHGLHDSFEAVWELTKDRAQFARIRLRFPNQRVVVIGDQLDRDIIPAKAAGCIAVLVPGPFSPSWTREEQSDEADYVATDFLAAVAWCIESRRGEPPKIR